MSLYSRYSESSISVSYFSRSSALIWSAVLLADHFGPIAQLLLIALRALHRRRAGSYLSPPSLVSLTRWGRLTLGHHPGARAGCHPPDVDERVAVLRRRPEIGERRGVRG